MSVIARVLLAVCSAAVFAFSSVATEATNYLTADEIIQRASEQGKWAEKENLWEQFSFNRYTVVKEFDKAGKLKELKELWYQVDDTADYPRLTGVKVNGEAVPAAKLKQEQDEQAKTHKAMAQKGTPAKRDAGEIVLTPDVTARYHFVLLGTEDLNGRTSYIVSFRPKSDSLPVKEPADRLLNQVYGRLWIDCAEFEVARAEIHLQGEIKLWAGLLAALQKFNFTVERVRLGEKIWFNHLAEGDFQARKLLDPIHIWLHADSTNYHRVSVHRDGLVGSVPAGSATPGR